MIIIIQCPDQVGLVSAITHVLTLRDLNITSLGEHVDKEENRFFIRLIVEHTDDISTLEYDLRQVLPAGAVININPLPQKNIVLMVTKDYHCLADVLIRNYFGTLGAKVQCVIGNHDNLRNICERFDVPFYLVSHQQTDKAEFEQNLLKIIYQYQPEFVVLAKFMRILSPQFVNNFPMRMINIHHSFLPAFIGASPYKQAYERGVKLIGATAHFVTNDLDEGPIITQQTITVNHTLTATDMVKAGIEIETAVLAKALQLVFDDRVLVYKNKTIVFE